MGGKFCSLPRSYFPSGPTLLEICTCSPTDPSPQLSPAVNGSKCSTSALLGQEPCGDSWAGETLLSPKPIREGAGGLSGGHFSLHQDSKEVGTLWACPGNLPGIITAGGRRQVMLTLRRPELPKGFNQPFESAPALSLKTTTRAAYLTAGHRCLWLSSPCSSAWETAGYKGFFLLLQA